jgi:hypothetical protein
MSDKKIIIDGIDITGCEYYCEPHCKQVVDEDGCYVFLCAEDKNCHYKKWQRKEQECEEWQAKLAYKESELQNIEETIKPLMKRPDDLDCYNLELIVCAFANEFNQLKAEKKELIRYKSLFEKTRDLWNEARMNNYKLLNKIEDLKDSLKRTICQSECYRYKEAEKLKQTLVEIKEIAENATKCLYTTKSNDYTDGYRWLGSIILQKICEVENENA